MDETIGTAQVRIGANLDKFEKKMRRVSKTLKDKGEQFSKVGKTMTRRFTLPIVAGAGAAVKAYADFDEKMNQSLAIMGEVSGPMSKQMRDAAREVGKTTRLSATEAAESYFFLASAGLDAEQSIAALPAVAQFAQAGMFDMSVATDLATDAQSALGLVSENTQENLKNLTRVTDVLVGANTLANASVEQFSTSLTREAGAALKSMNKDVEEGVAVLAAFADQGVKGERAGTGLSRIIRLMTQAANNNKDEMKELGLEVFDAEGNMRNMADIVENLEDSLGGMSDQQRTAALESIGFTARVQGMILPLLGTSDAIREYEGELRNMSGITKEVADNQLKSFSAQMGLLKDELIDVGISIGERLVPIILRLRDGIQKLIEWWKGLSEGQQKVILIILGVIAVIGPLLVVVGTLMKLIALIAGPIKILIGLFKGVIIVGKALALVVAGISAPVLIVIGVITALIAIGVLLWKNWDTITQKAKSLWGKVTEFFSRLGESIGEIIDNIIEFFSNMWRNIKGIWGRVISFIRGIPRKIIVALASLTSTVWNFIKKYHPVAMLFRAVRNNWGGFIGWIKGIPKRIINALGNMGKLLFSTGKDMINGLISGAGSILKNIGTFLLDKIPKWIVGPFKKALGISSPSKVFMGLGEDTMAGFNVGLGEGLKDPLSSLTDSSRRFTQTFASGIEDGLKMMNQSGNQFAGAMANSTSVSTVVHGGINIGNQQQSEDFLGRLTRNRELAKMGLSMEG